MKNYIYILLLAGFFISENSFSQDFSNLRQRVIHVKADTIKLDSLSIIPKSEIIFLGDKLLDNWSYRIDYSKSLLIVKDKALKDQQIKLSYRVFPLSFTQSFEHKKIDKIEKEVAVSRNPFLFEYTVKNEDIFYLNGLSKRGSISRGVTFGNNQNLAVNSNLNLQLSGKLNDNINILASISDDNIPIQADGNTQQLQEFDKVFIQLFNDNWKLTAGDFYLKRPKSYFMSFNKRAQGGSFDLKLKTSKKNEFNTLKTTMSAAVSKGKFARNKMQGIEGNQGPYRLIGAENETFIIVLSGTEKIYIDGKLMKRGQNFDYTIDYNTAELTFTANRIITKDSRITAEFQYSDRNYARSLVHFGNDYESKKLTLHFNLYSEQDSKNQPLQQDLTQEQKDTLNSIGDSLHLAVVPNIIPVSFSNNLVLYKVIDTLGYTPVYVYSTNPDSAIYQLGFSNVGANQGDYIQIKSDANGRVYEWVPPIAGIPQGEYEPVVLLITPKITQMATFGGEYVLSDYSKIGWEGAISNNDINTFSDKDRSDNIGYAFKLNSKNKIRLNKDQKDSWQMDLGLGYEFIDRYFKSIERFRTVEFQRDWNISNAIFSSNQYIFNAYTGISKKKKADMMYHVKLLKNEGEYEGLNNILSANYNLKGFLFNGKGSYLTTKGVNNTQFLRHKETLTKGIGWLVVGVSEEAEKNEFFLNNTDSLLANSFEFLIRKVFVHNADTTINQFAISYQQREDKTAVVDRFNSITKAEDIELMVNLLKSKNHKFRSKLTYRKLDIQDSSLTTFKPEENILSKIEYVGRFLKSAITINTYYEIGSGLEVKKEFQFLEVQPGQGTHAYIGDLDDDGVQDLNEYQVSIFQDQADYIKVFTPTTDFVRVYTNQFNQGVYLRPETKWSNKKGIKRLVARFSNRTNYRVSQKVTDKSNYYNPFNRNVTDGNLVTLNLSLLNTLSFNRTSTKYGIDFIYQDSRDKSLLTNGIQSRGSLNRAVRARWNITRVYTINLQVKDGSKSNTSEFFKDRDYKLFIQEVEPKFSIQPNVKFRASALFNYKEKMNQEIFGGEKSISRKIGIELRYNAASKGSFMANFNYINIDFSNADNASLTYEMLEGLQEGKNMTWGVTYQQSLSKYMQLNLNYIGRQSEGVSTVHSGGVQVRAFF